ncbi:MAG: hypothetical protein HQ510_07235 [Candidatus Marinimicrobia bacterium]|nr:hypothetical protein [Candidatus Neomarinimicrobiota bacterium]
MIKSILISIIAIIGLVICQSPESFELKKIESQTYFDSISTEELSSNSIRHIRKSDDLDILFLATSSGLGFVDYNNPTDQFAMFDRDLLNLPVGGNPGLDVNGQDIAVSGVIQVEAADGIEPEGTGIGYSSDGGQTWGFKPQPVDPSDSPTYTTFNWGEPGFEQEIRKLSVTTEIDNVSYDVAILGDYIYAASWAGGLQRFQFKNVLLSDGEDPNPWEPIPLPMDNELDQECGLINTEEFELNPKDPSDGGSHNHKGFSVHAVDDTLWVGTAGGINKGVLQPGECINWRHYNSYRNDISGNWVIGFADHILTNEIGESFQRIWAITWSTGGYEKYGLSYTDDGGYSWNVAEQLTSMNLRIYGISTEENRVFVSSDTGLYFSLDGIHWEKMSYPAEEQGEQLLTEAYFSCLHDSLNNRTWVGSPDGIAFTDNLGVSWEIIRFWNTTLNATTEQDRFYAYPNPMYTGSYNVFQGDSFVRFVFEPQDVPEAQLAIFDFAMAKVIELDQSHLAGNGQEILWNCRNDWGDKVANGVYFCRLTASDKTLWTKVVVIND